VLSIFIILFALAIMGGICVATTEHHGAVITFLGTLCGSVTGYFFAGRHNDLRRLRNRQDLADGK
jgi:hypothetical protein